MMILRYLRNLAVVLVVLPVFMMASGCSVLSPLKDEPAVDEAKAAGKTPEDFPELALDLFRDMDGGIALNENEIKGRNTWVMWTAGNQAFSYIGDRSFTGRAGQLSYDDESGMLRMDVNGDRVADGSIHVANEYDLASYDFIL